MYFSGVGSELCEGEVGGVGGEVSGVEVALEGGGGGEEGGEDGVEVVEEEGSVEGLAVWIVEGECGVELVEGVGVGEGDESGEEVLGVEGSGEGVADGGGEGGGGGDVVVVEAGESGVALADADDVGGVEAAGAGGDLLEGDDEVGEAVEAWEEEAAGLEERGLARVGGLARGVRRARLAREEFVDSGLVVVLEVADGGGRVVVAFPRRRRESREPGLDLGERDGRVGAIGGGEAGGGGGRESTALLGGGGVLGVRGVVSEGEDGGEAGLELRPVEGAVLVGVEEVEAEGGARRADEFGEAGGEVGGVDLAVAVAVEDVECAGDDGGLEGGVEALQGAVEVVAREAREPGEEGVGDALDGRRREGSRERGADVLLGDEGVGRALGVPLGELVEAERAVAVEVGRGEDVVGGRGAERLGVDAGRAGRARLEGDAEDRGEVARRLAAVDAAVAVRVEEAEGRAHLVDL
mmetsp:Transcript_11320/g.35891  ORF Transcript_11320/g.35891 Transcript_11320/m.35891 type:complete len:466 (-) Transcript_11320:747-2144(-)